MATNFNVSSRQGFKLWGLSPWLPSLAHPCLTLAWASQYCRYHVESSVIDEPPWLQQHFRRNPETMGKILLKPSKIKEQWEKCKKNPGKFWERLNRIFSPIPCIQHSVKIKRFLSCKLGTMNAYKLKYYIFLLREGFKKKYGNFHTFADLSMENNIKQVCLTLGWSSEKNRIFFPILFFWGGVKESMEISILFFEPFP